MICGEIFWDMERLIHYITQYTALSEEAAAFLKQHGQLHYGSKDSYYVIQHGRKSSWCWLLQGLLAFEFSDTKGSIHIERLGLVNQYFSGTKHPYSLNGSSLAIRFLQDSLFYEISNPHFQKAIHLFPEFGQVYHILKQQYLNNLEIFLHISKLERVQRLSYLYSNIPQLKGQLTVAQLCSLLGYTNHRQYYKALSKLF